MAKKKKSSDSGGLKGDEWLGTYSDCVTLLLTFFVLLYSMSSLDAEKAKAISEAFTVMKEANLLLAVNQKLIMILKRMQKTVFQCIKLLKNSKKKMS